MTFEGILAAVMDEVMSVLECEVDPEESLARVGLDSIGAVELRNRLQTLAGEELPAVVVFDYPSARALSDHIMSIYNKEPALVPTTCNAHGDWLWEGGAGVQVLQSQNMQRWECALEGQDLITPVPFSRWDESVQTSYGNGDASFYCNVGAWLRDVQEFDFDCFGINVYEAVGMDPQQRLLLEQTGQMLHSTGVVVDEQDRKGGSIGTYVGIPGASDFSTLCTSLAVPKSSYTATGIISVASGRLSYVFNLKGASISIDTACSSSLVALHQACESISNDRVTGAVAAGAMLILVPQSTQLLQLGGILSDEGRCKVLDESTDGYVRGEDVAVALLWSQRAKAGTSACGYILAHAVNNDGASSSLTAPYGPAQRALMQGALAASGLQRSFPEGCHLSCNGSNLGDVIEVNAVHDVFLGTDMGRSFPFSLMSIKSSTGHQEAASGVAVLSAVKAVISGAALPPLLHLRNLNPHVELALGVSSALLPRSHGTPLTQTTASLNSGINSFALQGTNAHALVSSARPTAPTRSTHVFSQKNHCWPAASSYLLAPAALPSPGVNQGLRFAWSIRPSSVSMLAGCQQSDLRTMPPGVMVSAAAAAVAIAHRDMTERLVLGRLLQHVGAKQATSMFETTMDTVAGTLNVVGISSKTRVHLRCQVTRHCARSAIPRPLSHDRVFEAPLSAALCGLEMAALNFSSGFVSTASVDTSRATIGLKAGDDGLVLHPGEVEASTQLSSILHSAQHFPPLEGMWGVLREVAALIFGPPQHSTQLVPQGNSSMMVASASESQIACGHFVLTGVLLDEYQLLEGSDTEDVLRRGSTEKPAPKPAPLPDVLTAILTAADSTDLSAFIESVVIDAVEGILGTIAGDDDNLYDSGMDSRAGTYAAIQLPKTKLPCHKCGILIFPIIPSGLCRRDRAEEFAVRVHWVGLARQPSV
jgi:3-oxoacyl-(acyl-carrier-protein) synthase/acyl carrier protein